MTHAPASALVLHSGGLDSTVALALAIRDNGRNNVATVGIDYGSKHAKQELEAAFKIAKHLGVAGRYRRYTLLNIFGGGGSALMGDIEMPHVDYATLHNTEGPSPTVVPFRNANLISVATTIAARDGYDLVYVGMHAEDAHNWAYPDCTPEFLGAMAACVYIGTYKQVRLVFPLCWMMKREVVQLGDRLQVPFHLTWSCYDPVDLGPDENPITAQRYIHCGKCPTCIERKEAFTAANILDPTDYAV